MQYDIAAKRLMEMDGKAILRTLARLHLKKLRPLDELPQEQATIMRCDYVARCTRKDGSKAIVLLEFQTRWLRSKILDMLVYTAQRMRRHRLPVLPIMILFRPNKAATASFQSEALSFRFTLVKMWEIDASLLLQSGQPVLWPLAALARDGLATAGKLDKLIHESALPSSERSDLLSIFAIFLGMRDKAASQKFIQKRRELMIDSPVYQWIKNEGLEEGLEKGLEKGRQALRVAILKTLQSRFGKKPSRSALHALTRTTDSKALQSHFDEALRCKSLADFDRFLAPQAKKR